MKVLRRFCSLGVLGVLTAGMLSGVVSSTVSATPASANLPEVFAATASAQALKLSLFGTTLTISSTNAEGDTTPKAHADGAGAALITASSSVADSTGANQSVATPKNCGIVLPLQPLAGVLLACSQSTSVTASGVPSATATSNIADIDVNLLNPVLNLLKPILDALTPLANQVLGTVLNTVQNAVQPLLGSTLPNLLGKLGIDVNKPVSSLITALQKATNLITIHVGDTTSNVATTADAVTADSVAQGAKIDVLPGLLVNGDPLLSITVGMAHTTSTYNRVAGTSAATFDPAILSIDLLGSVIPIKLGSPIDLLAGTPLESIISLGGGATTTNADKSVSAVADGVGLDLLKGINGGISLHLAHAESAAGGHTDTVTAATPTTTPSTTSLPVVTAVEPVRLATTGTSAPLLPVGFVLVLAGYLTRRTFRSRRAARAPR